jgi:uncharacterized protein (TIGR01777 family)
MNVLLSGSHGLIGSALVDRLRREGHTVIRLVRPGGDSAGAADGANLEWDPAAGRLDRAALDRSGPIDAVVNLAGAGIGDRRWSASRRRLIDASRRLSTRLLAETAAALDPAPSVVVSASAVGIYGDRGDEILTEASAPGTGFLADVCRAWEAAAGPAADAGIRVVCLRSGVVLSPDGGFLPRVLPLFRVGLGGRLGSGRQFVSWITLADEVDVILRAIADERLAGPVNATAPGPVTNGELTKALGRALHRPTPFAVPRPALGLAMGHDLAGELILASQRVVPAALEALNHRFGTTDLDDALASMVGAHPTARG